MISAGGHAVRQCGHLGPFSAHETQTISRQCAHCRVPDSDGCLRQTIHAVAAFRSERIILQKKMPSPIVARAEIVRRRMTTAIFVAGQCRNTIIALRARPAPRCHPHACGTCWKPLLMRSQIFQKLFRLFPVSLPAAIAGFWKRWVIVKSDRGLRPPRKSQRFSCWPASVALRWF